MQCHKIKIRSLYAAQHFADLNKTARDFCVSASSCWLPYNYRFHIRGGATPPRTSALIREALTVPPVSASNLRDATPPGLLARRQLASDDLPVVVRTFIHARGKSQRFDFVKNPTTDSAEALPGICGVSVFDAALHVSKHGRSNAYEHPSERDNWSERNERTH